MPPKRGLESVTLAVSTKKKIKSSATQNAVLNFFRPASQKLPEPTTWRVIDGSLLIGKFLRSDNQEEKRGDRRKIAGFDLDGTLIVTQSGNRHAKTETDWKWWHECVPGKLKQLHEEGYQIIIFTNQAGIKAPKKETANLKKFKLKVASVLAALDIPLTLYAATENDHFRKPRTGMWEEMKDDYDLDVHGVDLENSFLVGDAAGREGDFSDSDRHWALNVGIGFHTPEEFFLNQPGEAMFHRFDPASHIIEDQSVTTLSVFKPSEGKEIVVFVGFPGAGKSTFFRRHLQPMEYERVNQDILKSRDKCVRVAREFLAQEKSVAIDNTNADIASRAVWISLAKEHDVPVRCLHFTAHQELCQHNDAVRAFGGELVNPEKRTVLPKMAFSGYASRFKAPEKSEGFEDVITVDFQWQGGVEERAVWTKYWI